MISNKYILIFLDYQKAFNSPMTYKHYSESLIHFERYVASKNINLENLTLLDYNNYVLHLRTRNLANRTIITYTRAVKTLYTYLYENGFIKSKEYLKFKLIRNKKKIKMPLFNEDVKKIDSCLDLSLDIDLRNYIIIHLMLDCGLRVSEVSKLKKEDITENYISIKDAKGGKDRIIPISEQLYQKIIKMPNMDELQRIRYQGIKTMIQRLSKKSGVKFYSHLLRHTFATSYIYYGGNISFLSLILGHSSISTTEKYVHLSNSFKLLDTIDIYKINYKIK